MDKSNWSRNRVEPNFESRFPLRIAIQNIHEPGRIRYAEGAMAVRFVLDYRELELAKSGIVV